MQIDIIRGVSEDSDRHHPLKHSFGPDENIIASGALERDTGVYEDNGTTVLGVCTDGGNTPLERDT
jgi:hypothetical protein